SNRNDRELTGSNETTHLPRLLLADASRRERRGQDDSLSDRAFWQSRFAFAVVRVGTREGSGGGAWGSRTARELRPEGNCLDFGCDRGDQSCAQRRGTFLQGQGQAPRYRQNRAQGDARYHARARARRV